MTIRIWLAAAHHGAFRCGGWAHVRLSGPDISGLAGGARQITAERARLSALLAALRGLPAPTAVTIHTASESMLSLGAMIAGAAEAQSDDLDLWAQIETAITGRAVRFVRVECEPSGPAAFVAAWADLARDKAKAGGPFSAVIPKVNLAKALGPKPDAG
jgi:ribonuclease HI